MSGEGQTPSLFYDLFSIVFNILLSLQLVIPTTTFFLASASELLPYQWHSTDSASMLPRLLMPLILAGSVTFVIGFMLMPWVLGMLTVFYLAGIVSNLSVLGRAILFPSSLFGPKMVKGEIFAQ
ncbi:hypothetical protein GW17_00041610 [Ensete ventricosum]|nr:hypothetical protein GW17_00041610 [Ensete ventricosum]